MDEILYIARIDGRPWAGHGAVTKSIVPFVLFFGSLETTRYLLNERVQIPEFEKYFVTALAALLLIFLHDFGIARWRTAYTTKFIQDLFFIALISTAAFNAASALLPDHWFVIVDPQGNMSDQRIRFYLSLLMTAAGVAYLIVRTHLHRLSERKRLEALPGARHFRRYSRRETCCLVGVYVADYVLATALIAYLILKA